MMVAIVGSSDLNLDEEDVYTYLCRVIYPRKPLYIVTSGEGVGDTARALAERYNLPCDTLGSYKAAIDAATFTLIFRREGEWADEAKYCARRGKLFKEYVIPKKS